MRLSLGVGNKPNKFPRLQVSTISYFSTNAYEVPWLHLNIASCVMKFLGHHCILTFVIFNYLLQPLTSSTIFLLATISFFLSHATWFWGSNFSTKDLLFSNDTILIEIRLGKYFILEFVIVKYWYSWIDVWVWKCYLFPIYAKFCLFVRAS